MKQCDRFSIIGASIAPDSADISDEAGLPYDIDIEAISTTDDSCPKTLSSDSQTLHTSGTGDAAADHKLTYVEAAGNVSASDQISGTDPGAQSFPVSQQKELFLSQIIVGRTSGEKQSQSPHSLSYGTDQDPTPDLNGRTDSGNAQT